MKNHFNRLSDLLARGVGYVFPPRQALPSFFPGVVRGSVWVLIATAVVSSLTFLGFLLSQLTFGIEEVFQVVVLAVTLSWADSPNFLVSQTSLGLEDLLFEIAARPTLLVVLIAFIGYLAGRRFARSEGASPVAARLYSVGLGVGFSGSLFALALAASAAPFSSRLVNLLGVSSDVRISLPDTADLVTAFLIVALPTWFGAWRIYSKELSSQYNPQKWLISMVSNFAMYYLIVITLLIVGFSVFQWIEPDFKPAVPESAPVELTKEAIIAIGLALLVILLFLPTILVAFASIVAGYSWSASYDGQTGELVSSGMSLVSNTLSGLGVSLDNNFLLSIWNANLIAWPAFAASVVVIGFIAAVAGANATSATGYKVVGDLAGLKLIAKFTLLAFAIQSLTNFKYATEYSSTAASGQDPEVVRQWLVFGISNASLILVSIVIFSAASLAGRFQQELFTGSLPRIAKLSRPSITVGERNIAQRLLGALVTVAVAASLFIPIGIAGTERAIASIDTPAKNGETLASKVQGGDIAALKKAFNSAKDESLNWLPTSSMEVALPGEAAELTIVTTNDLKKPWQVGNTDANVKLTWTEGDKKIVYGFSLKSEVKQHLSQIDYVVFANETAPVSLVLKVGGALKSAKLTDISVNGENVKAGEYAALPGSYLLETKGYKLVAAESVEVNTNNAKEMSFTLGEKLALPDGASDVLKKAVEKEAATCSTLDDKGNSECFSRATIVGGGKVSGGEEVSSYFEAASTKLKLESTKCEDGGKDTLVTATSMTRSTECTYTATFEKIFYDFKIKKVPTYRTDYYYYFCGWFICTGSRQVKTGERDEKVRGEELGRAAYTSEVKINVIVSAKLEDNNEFKVTNARTE